MQVVLPALVQLLVPPLRPVAANLQTPEERATLATLTDTMLAYNLRYDAAAGGAPPAAGPPSAATAATPLLPAVDALCRFEVGLSITSHAGQQHSAYRNGHPTKHCTLMWPRKRAVLQCWCRACHPPGGSCLRHCSRLLWPRCRLRSSAAAWRCATPLCTADYGSQCNAAPAATCSLDPVNLSAPCKQSLWRR